MTIAYGCTLKASRQGETLMAIDIINLIVTHGAINATCLLMIMHAIAVAFGIHIADGIIRSRDMMLSDD